MTLRYSCSESFTHSNKVLDSYQLFLKTIARADVGFFNLPSDTKLLAQCQALYERFKDRRRFVLAGIGGSSLGPEMLVSALGLHHGKTKFTFINNIDSDKLYEQLLCIDNPREALFYIVSKSGGTAETMAAFAILSAWLQEKGIAPTEFKNYFVFGTDPQKGDLRPLAQELGISCLDIPANVGGRYSVLTPVGLFPALFASIDVTELLKGAQKMAEQIARGQFLGDAANFLFHLFAEQNVSQTVLMPYSSKLKDFSAWFVQLWAESLGKKFSTKGEVVHTGLTPIASYGATDQHSQMQLFMEGPYDKCMVMVEVIKPHHDFPLKNSYKIKSLEKLAPYSLNQLMTAELYGTLKALKENKRPFIHLTVDCNDAYHLGELILFCESLTVLMGHCLNIDPFDQPGVEAGKIYAFEWLKKA